MVDLFPMADGKRPGESIYTYDNEGSKFFMNRDPRFYRTFAFPGVEWKFNSGDVDFSGTTMSGLCPSYYTDGSEYELWNYCWYASAADLADPGRSGYAADKLGTKNRSVYVRKRSMMIRLPLSMCLRTIVPVTSRVSDVRQLLIWRYVMLKCC